MNTAAWTGHTHFDHGEVIKLSRIAGAIPARIQLTFMENEKTLLDEFAMAALAGWMATYVQKDDIHPVANDCQNSLADLSYEMARAMMRARNKQEEFNLGGVGY